LGVGVGWWGEEGVRGGVTGIVKFKVLYTTVKMGYASVHSETNCQLEEKECLFKSLITFGVHVVSIHLITGYTLLTVLFHL